MQETAELEVFRYYLFQSKLWLMKFKLAKFKLNIIVEQLIMLEKRHHLIHIGEYGRSVMDRSGVKDR